MLTYHSRPVCLSLLSTDLPLLSSLETSATLYQKDTERFHLLLSQCDIPLSCIDVPAPDSKDKQLLWLEISPYRVIMTMQGRKNFAYRHFWEQGVYGVSRYWFNETDSSSPIQSFRLRNYTRSLTLEGNELPQFLRVEYELWTGSLCLGHYVLHLEIFH
ncbi:MAG: hypothetical protein AB4058_17595 [Microcystaceae cyanobacterium]